MYQGGEQPDYGNHPWTAEKVPDPAAERSELFRSLVEAVRPGCT